MVVKLCYGVKDLYISSPNNGKSLVCHINWFSFIISRLDHTNLIALSKKKKTPKNPLQ